jgi:hypothetical protein
MVIDHIQDYGSTKEASYDLEYFSFIEAISSLQIFSNQVCIYK